MFFSMRIRLFIVLGFLSIFLFIFSSDCFALPTYVGLRIEDLKDDPAASCSDSDDGDYGRMGRIRALSSIPPSFPIFMNLTKVSDGSQIWAGDIVENCSAQGLDGQGCDYTIGDVIMIPDSVSLDLGVNYNIFMDIDAIRIYLPLPDENTDSSCDDGWIGTADDEYWTAGQQRSVQSGCYFWSDDVGGDDCKYLGRGGAGYDMFYISNIRTTDLTHSCATDSSAYNCDSYNLMGIKQQDGDDFQIKDQYDNLYDSTHGNFLFGFTFN